MTTTINNEHKKLNAPNLRFPEFQGEWEEHKLEDITAEIGDGIHATPVYDDNGTFYFVNGNNISEYGITITATTQKVTEEEALKNNASALNSNSILLSINGTIGNVALYKNEPIMLGKSACYINVSSNANRNYIFYYLMMPKCQFYFISELTGTTIKNLSLKSVRKTKVLLPNAKEQNKIARLFDVINERIATQSKVIDKLQSLIKGIGDELLYNKTWAKVYLKDIFAFYSTNSLSWDKLSDENESGIRNLHYGMIHNLNSTILDIKTMPFIKTGYIPQKYELCQYGDIAFADASEDTDEIAKAVEFRKISNEEQAVCGLHTIHGRDIHDMTVVGFKGYALNANYFHQQIKRMAQGTKVFSITASNISNCFVFLPSKDEQKKVVGILDAISLKIQVETEVLNSYKIQKQYLLRQMFI